MKLRTKKMLSLLLASAMVFTMNTAVFAEEVTVDAAEEFVEVDSVDSVEEIPGIEAEVAATISPDGISANDVSGNSVSAQNLLLLSENGKRVEEELKQYAHEDIKGTDYSFTFRYTKAVGYDSRKLGWAESKQAKAGKLVPVNVQLWYYNGVSENGAISDNGLSGNGLSANTVDTKPGWVDITDAIKDVKIQSSKGATVDITGAGIVAAKDCAYIADIKLDKKSTIFTNNELDKKAVNALQKELSNSLKETAKAIKKNKTDKISANGLPEGKTADADKIKNLITVYPAYVYSFYDQTSYDIADTWGEIGLKLFYIGDPKKSDLDINSKKIIGLNKDKTTKAYNSEVKSLKGYFEWEEQGGKTKNKKITLKPDKVQSGKDTKFNGLSTTEEKAKAVKGVAVTGADGVYTVNTSGNFFGAVAFTPGNVK